MALSHFYLLFACIIAAALAVPPQSGTATVTFYQRAASWTHGGTGACGIPASGQLPYFTVRQPQALTVFSFADRY